MAADRNDGMLLNPQLPQRGQQRASVHINPEALKENMERKQAFILREPDRKKPVLVAMLFQEYEILLWRDPDMPSMKDKPPEEYEPKVTDEGLLVYELPYKYAERLIASEPYKFKYMGPTDFIRVPMPTTNGGESRVVMYRHIVKKDKNDKVERDRVGLPILIPDPEAVEAVNKELKV